MICQPCRDQDHDNCDDKMALVPLCKRPWIGKPPHCGKGDCSHPHGDEPGAYKRVKRKGRLYRSCVCQHQVQPVQPLAPAQVT